LLECFQWDANPDETALSDELADVLTYCLLLCAKQRLDPLNIISAKLEKTKAKYPIEKSWGKSTKYDQLHD
jgi:NTP pyrophosphatase (non-canonical NTP hydrolase)